MEETPPAKPLSKAKPFRKEQPSAFRQDLLRGVRWGTILLLVMLLVIAAYRVLNSSQAVASQPIATEELAPPPQVAPATPILVGNAELKGPDAPPAPEKSKARKVAANAAVPVPEPPQRLHAPSFAPLPVAAAPKPASNSFLAEPLPEGSPAPVPAVDLPAPSPVLAPAPTAAPVDNSKQGNRATRAVRSVGRLFRLGRKDEPEPSKK